ncbi:MAG: winged helix-turn-helix domain-containing protein [Isosphaeraceae bacterium]
MIEQEFGVADHKGHVARLLEELRWTPRTPIRRALQREEAAIERWRCEVWPELMTQAAREWAGCSFSWTKPGSTSCPGWSRPTPPRDGRRSSGRS